MRASFILLGPLLARFGRVIISNPGGDRIGRRPVNLHVDAMRALGAEIEYRNGYYFARVARPAARRGRHVPDRHRDGHRERDPRGDPGRGPHDHPARPPRSPRSTTSSTFLQQMGAEVERTAPDTIEVEGRRRLRGAEHAVIADRIEAGTFVVAAAVTGGEVTLTGAPSRAPGRVPRTHRADRRAGIDATADTIDVRAGDRRRLPGLRHRDGAVPGSGHRPPAADGRAADPGEGTSHIHETIFEDRLEWMEELRRMGARSTSRTRITPDLRALACCTARRSR